ncbi:hypothetical protein E1171_09920, partial [Cytophagales bacterium RKSG123]|nr:hypothetical protein [Xanthovirga aplysinae]
MKDTINIIIIVTCLLSGCSSNSNNDSINLSGPFFGIKPTDSVQILAPGIVSSNLFEYNGTFSPDGTEFYYTVNFPARSIIAFMELKTDNTWTGPAYAQFSTEYSDVDPIFSPDGTRLYFTSNRPTNDTSLVKRNNIWFVERLTNGWSTPQLVSLTEKGDYYSSLTQKGNIYFNSWKTGDIYKAIKTDSTYLIERLVDVINLDKKVGDPFISPNEDYLIFRGENLEGGYGSSD